MRISIRQKLVTFILLPTALIFVVVGGFSLLRLQARLSEQARQDARQLAHHYASLLDGRFQAVAQIAQSTAAALASQPDLSEEQLYSLLRSKVTQNRLVFGAAIAFEPFSFDPERRLVCPYVCEDPLSGTRQLDISSSYDYHGPDHEWFWAPRTSGQAGWTAPYFDEEAGEILMTMRAGYRQLAPASSKVKTVTEIHTN